MDNIFVLQQVIEKRTARKVLQLVFIVNKQKNDKRSIIIGNAILELGEHQFFVNEIEDCEAYKYLGTTIAKKVTS